MITCQVENWLDVKNEAAPLWEPHYDEVGQNKEKMYLNPDLGKLDKFESLGMLHIVTIRKDGELVGYHMAIIDTLLHYRHILAAHGDLYWIRKDCRAGGIPLKLFKKVEQTLKQRGVQVMYEATKLYFDHDRLFTHLGYKAIERKYSKWIGG